tara:strand:+ start:310 stop:1647 length:1338 start_codon:yes stop_codon:yes gene_type:complete
MFWLTSLGYLLLLFVIFTGVKDPISKWFITFIGSYWCISIIISTFNPYDINDVSLRTYVYLLIDIISFLFGYFVYNSIKKIHKKNSANLGLIDVGSFYKNKKFKAILLVSFSVLSYLAITQYKIILLQNGLGRLKLDFFDLVFNNNSYLYFLYQFFISPFFHVILALQAYLVFQGKDKKYMIIFGLYILLFAFVGGKRSYFLTFFFYLVVSFFVSNTYLFKKVLVRNYFIKKGKYIFLIFGLVFGFMVFMTSLSGGIGGDENRIKTVSKGLSQQFIIYSIGPFRAFDIGLDNNYLRDSGGHLFGRATLGGGIDYYITALLKRVGINIKSARELTMNKLQQTPIKIGKNIDFNFAYTNAMYHYYDFGVFGIFIFPFLFGIFVRYVIYKLYIKRTFSLYILLSFLFFACIQMLQFWYFIGLYPIAFVFFLLYLSRKEFKSMKKFNIK